MVENYWNPFVDPASTHASRAFAHSCAYAHSIAKVRLRRRYTPSSAQDDTKGERFAPLRMTRKTKVLELTMYYVSP